jgi:hypothetical protein
MLKEADQFRDRPEELDRPTLRPELSFYYNAFWILRSDRTLENGPIPFTAIDRFAERYGVCGTEAFERLRILVTRMMDRYRQKESATIRQLEENARIEATDKASSAKPPKPKLLSG